MLQRLIKATTTSIFALPAIQLNSVSSLKTVIPLVEEGKIVLEKEQASTNQVTIAEHADGKYCATNWPMGLGIKSGNLVEGPSHFWALYFSSIVDLKFSGYTLPLKVADSEHSFIWIVIRWTTRFSEMTEGKLSTPTVGASDKDKETAMKKVKLEMLEKKQQ